MAKTRPHFKVHLSVSHHRRMTAVYSDNDQLALWVRLGVLAVERYASRDGDVLRLRRSELRELTGGKRQDKAEQILNLVATNLQLTLNQVGDDFEITWRNFSKKQGFGESRANLRLPTDTDTEADTEAETEGGGRESDKLDDEYIDKLIAMRPFGGKYTRDQVRAWFDATQPKMAASGLKNFKRAAVNWWPNALPREVTAAVRKMQVIALESVRDGQSEAEPTRVSEDFRALMGKKPALGKLGDPLPEWENICPKCGEKKQPLENGIPHYCPDRQ